SKPRRRRILFSYRSTRNRVVTPFIPGGCPPRGHRTEGMVARRALSASLSRCAHTGGAPLGVIGRTVVTGQPPARRLPNRAQRSDAGTRNRTGNADSITITSTSTRNAASGAIPRLPFGRRDQSGGGAPHTAGTVADGAFGSGDLPWPAFAAQLSHRFDDGEDA